MSDSAPYTFDILTPLDDKTLNAGGEIVLVLQATLADSDVVNSATVIIALPDIPSPPEFSQNYYQAEYTEGADDTLGSIKLSNDITTDQDGKAALTVTILDCK